MTLVCQEDLVALSNMDVKSTSSVPNPHGAPQKAVTFNTTPPMSVYLLAFAVGQFDYAENKDFRIPIRVYSTIDKSTKQGQYAADLTARCLTFFEEQFGIAIPIAKMDSLALADKQGAMENLGLVTYAEGSLLYDPQLTSLSRKASLSSTIVSPVVRG
jgi:aminopeptidase 2